MQSTQYTHTSIALAVAAAAKEEAIRRDREWDAAALEMAPALANPTKKRNRDRFGMALDLRDALTRFARIDSPEKQGAFRQDFPDFFPSEFWNSWGYASDVPGSRPIQFWRVWQQLLVQAWHVNFHPDCVAQLIDVAGESYLCELPEFGGKKFRIREIRPTCDFQRAVQAMGDSPWRAAFCAKCSQPFVADKPQRDYCSDECRKVRQQFAFRQRWEKYGKKWRKRQRRAKSR